MIFPHKKWLFLYSCPGSTSRLGCWLRRIITSNSRPKVWFGAFERLLSLQTPPISHLRTGVSLATLCVQISQHILQTGRLFSFLLFFTRMEEAIHCAASLTWRLQHCLLHYVDCTLVWGKDWRIFLLLLLGYWLVVAHVKSQFGGALRWSGLWDWLNLVCVVINDAEEHFTPVLALLARWGRVCVEGHSVLVLQTVCQIVRKVQTSLGDLVITVLRDDLIFWEISTEASCLVMRGAEAELLMAWEATWAFHSFLVD